MQDSYTHYAVNAHQLAFCRVCRNRSFDVTKGTICSLTNASADFEQDCDTFSLDAEALEKTEANIRKAIFETVSKKHGYYKENNKHFKWLFYELPNLRYKTVQNTHDLSFKDITKKDGHISLSLGAIIVLIFSFFSVENNWLLLLCILAFFVAIGFFIYSLLTYFYYTHKTILKTTSKGCIYKEKMYYWSDINDFCVVNFSNNKGKYNKLIIGTISNGLRTIDLQEIQITDSEIIEILNLNIQEHYKNLHKKRGNIIIS